MGDKNARLAGTLSENKLEKYLIFSSRRRHTRYKCDWNSDVCSSDLIEAGFDPEEAKRTHIRMKSWSSVDRWPVKYTLNLNWFKEIGLIFLNDFVQSPQKPVS